MRELVRETALQPSDLVLPLFVVPGRGEKREIASLPGVYHYTPDQLPAVAKEAYDLGVRAVILFGVPEHTDATGSGAHDDNGPVPVGITSIKDHVPDLVVMTDVCLCSYMDHGHCGVLAPRERGPGVDNDRTLPVLAEEALCHARAGADVVAPSDMMDGRIGYIRDALDRSGFYEVAILSYAAKYASAFYGPFRDAAKSAPQQGDRRGYQMDPANATEALKEVRLDIAEGADFIMVKPALSYLDVVYRVSQVVDVPVSAYHVSGEYAMIKAAAERGMLDERAAVMEALTSIKRAGAKLILTYYAMYAAEIMQQSQLPKEQG